MSVQLFLSPRQHFEELVETGFHKLKIQTYPAVRNYLVDLLEYYLDTRNLYPEELNEAGQKRPQTMAEMWLTAGSLELSERIDLLKQMGDRALYISGFFSDSLQRKVVDIDYYAEMGGAAYATLADSVREDTSAQVFRVFSRRFTDFADVLSFISQQSLAKTDESVLRLYEKYLRTGSELAREQLAEMGVITVPAEQAKKARQD
jgi:hypothetical protein